MKLIFNILATLFLIFYFALFAKAQFLNLPESIVYDSLYNRYLVSSWNTGNLVQIDSNDVQSFFLVNQACYAGLCIVDGNVYAAGKSEGVRGFNLSNGDSVMNVSIPGSRLLNDITADNSGNLYLSDPQAHKIYRVRISDHTYSTFVSGGINVPNGILFDEPNNRLILVSARNNSPIQAISLVDSSVSTIIYTSLDILDGLTVDNQGNYYISSWGSSSVYRFDNEFSNPPEFISSHRQQPADIFFNKLDNILAVPIYYYHDVDFIPIEPTYINDNYADRNQFSDSYDLSQNYPNPFNTSTTIQYNLPKLSDVNIVIYDILGRKIEMLVSETQLAGNYRVIWDASDKPSGLYYYRFTSDDFTGTRKILLLK